MTQTIAFMNQKGGAGKTTTLITLAVGLAKRGYKLLIVDLDPQGIIGIAFGAVDEMRRPAENINRMFQVDETILTPLADNVDGILGGQKTANAAYDVYLNRGVDCLKEKLDAITGYDFILIDMPPTTTPFTPAVMHAADYIVMPTVLAGWSLDGLQRVAEFWVNLKSRGQHIPDILGVVPTMTSKGTATSWTRNEKELYAELVQNFPNRVWPFTSMSTVWKKAAEENRTVLDMDATNGSAKAVRQAQTQAQAIVKQFLEALGYDSSTR